MKKYMSMIVAVTVTLLVGLVIGSVVTYRSLPPDRAFKLNLMLKGEDLGMIPVAVVKRNLGTVREELLTFSDKAKNEAAISIIEPGTKEIVDAHLIRREGGSFQLVFKD